MSDNIQDGKTICSVSPSSNVLQVLIFPFLALLSIAVKSVLIHTILHTHTENANYKRQVVLPSGNTAPNGTNYSELNNKNLICFVFVAPSAPMKHHYYTVRLVTHIVFSGKAFSYLSTPHVTVKVDIKEGKTIYICASRTSIALVHYCC